MRTKLLLRTFPINSTVEEITRKKNITPIKKNRPDTKVVRTVLYTTVPLIKTKSHLKHLLLHIEMHR